MPKNICSPRNSYSEALVASIDDRCAEEAGFIRAELAAQGNPIGPNDLLIAGTAPRAYDPVLVTHNTNEFVRITGLRLVDWEKE